MTIDFFVHPEYDNRAPLRGGEVKKEYPKYFSHLKKYWLNQDFQF